MQTALPEKWEPLDVEDSLSPGSDTPSLMTSLQGEIFQLRLERLGPSLIASVATSASSTRAQKEHRNQSSSVGPNFDLKKTVENRFRFLNRFLNE